MGHQFHLSQQPQPQQQQQLVALAGGENYGPTFTDGTNGFQGRSQAEFDQRQQAGMQQVFVRFLVKLSCASLYAHAVPATCMWQVFVRFSVVQ